ncbi:hypothetical protein ACWDNT_23755 [Streptomyces sp. NPDC000963]
MRPTSCTAPGAAAAWGDDTHHAEPGSFGGIGTLGLRRNGELLGETGRPASSRYRPKPGRTGSNRTP